MLGTLNSALGEGNDAEHSPHESDECIAKQGDLVCMPQNFIYIGFSMHACIVTCIAGGGL